MNRFYAPFLLVPFAVQLAVLVATGKRFRPLRFAVPVLAVLASIAAIIFTFLYFSPIPDWEENGLALVLNIFLILSGVAILRVLRVLASLVLIGWGLAWAVYYLIKRIRARKSQSV